MTAEVGQVTNKAHFPIFCNFTIKEFFFKAVLGRFSTQALSFDLGFSVHWKDVLVSTPALRKAGWSAMEMPVRKKTMTTAI